MKILEDLETLAMQEPEKADVQALDSVDTDEQVNWFLRKLGNLDAEKRRVKAQADSIIRDLEGREKHLRFVFEGAVRAYVEAQLAGGKSKTLKFLQGSCSLRTVPERWSVADSEAALNYARNEELFDLIKVVTTVDGSAYIDLAKQTLEESGELLPGLEKVPARESFSIKFKEGSDG